MLSWAQNPAVSPQKLWPLLRERGGAEGVLGSDEADLAHALGSMPRAREVLRAANDHEALVRAEAWRRAGMEVLTPLDREYPPLLVETADPPFCLLAQGDLQRLAGPAVAVVGSRDASRYGRDVAAALARDLSSVGVTVLSGFARGIDAEAHEAAREGIGGTVAVLGCGIDVDYPRENARLRRAMLPRNLFISEYPPGTEPRAQNFPVRNRIIAGMSSGVVVVEASRRSGSLITARLAADAGRDVFAVPGSVFSERSAGTHALLRDGAILCRGAEDVLTELFPSLGVPAPAAAPPIPAELSAEARRLLELLISGEGMSAEELSRESEMAAATVLAALLELEGAGVASLDAGGRYVLRQPAIWRGAGNF
ncbi:MAG TPA: DNA-processing protein DprA [Thermoanaerobaculia bacterium]|jgi:DNA processing protein